MKTLSFTLSLFTLIIAVPGFAATSQASESTESEITQIREKIVQCSVRPRIQNSAGGWTALPWSSECQEVRVYEDRAEIETAIGAYEVYIYDSENTDGGDLNDIEIIDASGNVLETANGVLAFGDVLFAVAGHDSRVPTVELP